MGKWLHKASVDEFAVVRRRSDRIPQAKVEQGTLILEQSVLYRRQVVEEQP